jgi:CheY-like chemotaxis protein
MRHTLYVVDDDPIFLSSFGELLVEHGYRVVLFQSGEQLIRHQPTARPSLVISDYAMPGMSGDELVRRLWRDSRWRDVPTVVITGTKDSALPLRLETPVVYKENVEGILGVIRSALGPKDAETSTAPGGRRASKARQISSRAPAPRSPVPHRGSRSGGRG